MKYLQSERQWSTTSSFYYCCQTHPTKSQQFKQGPFIDSRSGITSCEWEKGQQAFLKFDKLRMRQLPPRPPAQGCSTDSGVYTIVSLFVFVLRTWRYSDDGVWCLSESVMLMNLPAAKSKSASSTPSLLQLFLLKKTVSFIETNFLYTLLALPSSSQICFWGPICVQTPLLSRMATLRYNCQDPEFPCLLVLVRALRNVYQHQSCRRGNRWANSKTDVWLCTSSERLVRSGSTSVVQVSTYLVV